MITVSEKMKAYLLTTGRTFKGKIEVGTVTVYDGIMSILTDKSVCADCLTLGAVNCSYAEIAIYGSSQIDFAGKEIKIYISAEIDGANEWIKLGEFIVEKPLIEENLTTFTAYDCIKYKTGNIYFPSASLPEEAPIDSVFADVCGQCNIGFTQLYPHTVEEADKPKVKPAVLSGFKCSAVLGMLAGFLGGNIICNNEGEIEVRKFTECDYTIHENMFSAPKIGEDIFTVERISCKTADGILTSGNADGQGIDFENLLMTQTQLDNIFESLQGLSFQSIYVENLVGNPCVEAGDIITMQYYDKVYKVPVMHIVTDFDGGVMNTIEAFVKTAEEEKGDFESISEVMKEVAETVTRDTSEFAQTINGALGLYTSKQTLADGSTKIYYHNAPNIAESTYIYTQTGGGIAFVTGENCWNNGNPVWQYGIESTGNAILNFLQANKISADLIEAGVLKSIKTYDGENVMEFDLDNGTIKSVGEQEVITGVDSDGEAVYELVKGSAVFSNGGIRFRSGNIALQLSANSIVMIEYIKLPFGSAELPLPRWAISKEVSMFPSLRLGSLFLVSEFSSSDVQLVEATNATGWIEDVCAIRSTGSKVQLKGTVSFTTRSSSSANNIVLANITKAELRPKKYIYKIVPLSGQRVARMGISPNSGEIFVDWVIQLTGASAGQELFNENISWLQLDCEWDI